MDYSPGSLEALATSAWLSGALSSMKAPCSVWMAPQDSPARISRILAPVDFSPMSADAISMAASIANRTHLEELLALHVCFNSSVVSFREPDEEFVQQQQDDFYLFAARVDLHGIKLTSLLKEAHEVTGAILHAAEEHKADLIVNGDPRTVSLGCGPSRQRDRACPPADSDALTDGEAFRCASYLSSQSA
ncbi:MAG: universal stress protein [Acidimicrobiia bacterium]|nr:universal stress protein [Acidimicrobiia bacterium]